ncbi:hypothetical protein ABZ816_24150 [Actinosynnema sp. NPDC047251]|uniref:Uncharacterized protein n=1 Tax=Saccharothrix espanaensis (strain ATCC 51144 / DSM 44229 / JCM 9112 / NBRC 15066 / NRRL 15764) TaxID=1179773 RepID=K0K499_SACES|nr:hypothetical protein [Saccharothrix espanaensis]CCH32432.1 hypothetical protein BN6_51660 [Saccharothrix espanaensis DSM 44229]
MSGNPLVVEARGKADEVDRILRRFFETVNRTLSWVPAPLRWVVEQVEELFRQVNAKISEFWARVDQLFRQPGDSDRLNQVAEEWSDKVGNVLGDIAGTIGLDKMQTNVAWTGKAARAYAATVPPQAAGLNAVKDVSNQMRSSLVSLANSIDAFWIAIGVALATLVVSAIAAVAAACTVVGAPAAIGAIAGGLAVAIGIIGATVMALESHTNTIEAEQQNIAQKIRDIGTEWTMPNTADMSDASVTDGDGSDWSLER